MIRIFIGLFLFLALSSCLSTKNIKDGRTAHQQKQYSVAVDMLLDEISGLSEGEEYAELSFLLGESFKYLNDSENSLKWFIEAAKNNYGPDSFWEMSYMLKKNERYEDAILSFQRLAKMTSGRQNEISIEIEKCKQARRWTDISSGNKFELSALEINSGQSDYAPFLMDEQYIIFTSDRLEIESETYSWTGNSFSDLYVFQIGENVITPFSDEINTNANEGTACFNKDLTEIYFTRCDSEVGDSYCKIYTAQLEGGSWSKPVVAFRTKAKVNYGDPVLIENDSVLIFTSNDPIGIGSHDLYYSLRDENNEWSDPELMPPYLNTIGEERFPRWDNGTLYYSSDFLPGLGGLDIFKTKLNEDGSWTQPENIMAPINSSEDDYSYVEIPDSGLPQNIKKLAYFTSTRGVFGNDDIYSLTEYKSPEDIEVIIEEEVVSNEPKEDINKSFFLEIRVVEKIFAVASNPNSYVVGMKNVNNASIRFTTPNREDIFQTKETGTILVPVDTAAIYGILVGKQGYLNNGVDFEITGNFEDIADGHVFKLDIEIEKMFTGVEITLDNIYYDFNESFIRDDAKPSLDYLIKILRDNPAVSIELSSHTDCRGDDDYNLNLSRDRAKTAITYIGDIGMINATRLNSNGFGETQPEIDCDCDNCTEEEHQINRRTTFRIIEK